MVEQERTIVPLLGVATFGLSTATAALSFLVAFGLTKAVTILSPERGPMRVGRKPVLLPAGSSGCRSRSCLSGVGRRRERLARIDRA
jgi:hypothetical protein